MSELWGQPKWPGPCHPPSGQGVQWGVWGQPWECGEGRCGLGEAAEESELRPESEHVRRVWAGHTQRAEPPASRMTEGVLGDERADPWRLGVVLDTAPRGNCLLPQRVELGWAAGFLPAEAQDGAGLLPASGQSAAAPHSQVSRDPRRDSPPPATPHAWQDGSQDSVLPESLGSKHHWPENML